MKRTKIRSGRMGILGRKAAYAVMVKAANCLLWPQAGVPEVCVQKRI